MSRTPLHPFPTQPHTTQLYPSHYQNMPRLAHSSVTVALLLVLATAGTAQAQVAMCLVEREVVYSRRAVVSAKLFLAPPLQHCSHPIPLPALPPFLPSLRVQLEDLKEMGLSKFVLQNIMSHPSVPPSHPPSP